MSGTLRPLLACVLMAGALPALAAPAASMGALQARVDALAQSGYEEPEPALLALASELPRHARDAAELRVLQLGRGLVAAASGHDAEAADAIKALGLLRSEPLVEPDAALVRATQADSLGNSDPAAQAAQAAVDGYRLVCPALPGCDYRSSWRALQLLARHQDRSGQRNAARDAAVEAAELARGAGDVARQAWALAIAADIDNGDDSSANKRLLDRALGLASQVGDKALLARVRIYESRVLRQNGDLAGALAAADFGLAEARQAHAPRLAAIFQNNLADLQLKAGRPRLALHEIEQALPVVRRFHDKRAERALQHNAALARLGLGEFEFARRALEELLAADHAGGTTATEADALREFADAFAAAGQLRDALALYHRERDLTVQITATNRDTTLAGLRKRFDREAQQRRLDQLAQDNALMSARIDNRAAMQRIWSASAALVALAMAVVAFFYQRVAAINRRLARNQSALRAQSQLDPLTGLANRRGLRELAAAQRVDQFFTGALLLIDIDHFKHVNDDHGHAAGDAVIVEVARRLAEVVRPNDLVVRWGGEEFLAYVPDIGIEQVQALARRVLQAVGDRPVALGPGRATGALRVTVSVGFACFPLPTAQLPLALERAVNFTDMALYTAKNQGRNRAVGVAGVRAIDDQALRRIEADFDQARHDGLVQLLHVPGPACAEPTAVLSPQVAFLETRHPPQGLPPRCHPPP
jgi:diguanylate cyclase (GGDEF)-like protein